MATFRDVNGREWVVNLTARIVDRFEAETGESFFGEVATGKIRLRTAWRLAWFAVRDKARELGIENYEDWLDEIGKSAVGPMTTAVMNEIAEFFPGPEEQKPSRPPQGGPGAKSTS